MLRAAAPVQRRDTDGVLRVETLAATFEEVEFLLSLGLAVNAAGVLKSYLQDSGSPAPIAFFELIRLCEHEGDSAAAALVRRRYAQVFGAEAPPLELVTAPLGLDSLAGPGASITSGADPGTGAGRAGGHRALECDQAQGFLYGPPVPADQLVALLKAGPFNA